VPKKTRQLAKLTRPRLHKAVARGLVDAGGARLRVSGPGHRTRILTTAMKRSQLAKLTRLDSIKRWPGSRLFAKLDDAREHKSAICVVGPPGAGKTTLVASLARRPQHRGHLVPGRSR